MTWVDYARRKWQERERREAMSRMRLIVWVVGIAAVAIWWLVWSIKG